MTAVVVPVPLVGDLVAVVDAVDAELVKGYTWRALHGHNGKVYAYHRSDSGLIYMHRVIAGTPAGYETDHVNGDGLDNRRSNLRVATPSQNSANTGKPRRSDGRPHTSRFKGVSWDRSRGRWQAKITVARKCYNLGRYDDERSAAIAYDEAASRFWGAFARVNLPAVSV